MIGKVALTLIKVAERRLGDTEESLTRDGPALIYSSRVRSLVDAVYDWSRFDSLPRGYDWIRKELAFKGGTCLAKVHANFYRMSEDLDFVISSPCDASRKERSLRVASLRKRIDELPGRLPVFRVNKPLTGANDSKQYLAEIGYSSLDTGRAETIKLEVSLR